MNPLTNMKNVLKLSEQELYTGNKTSWHDQYRDSAWLFIGGLPFDLTEGDIVCIFSQYGEIVNINLIRDKDTGKSKGFCFLCYEDQRSTVLAVDNLNGIKVLNRAIRVDHVSNYKVPKQGKKTDAETKKLYEEGCGPKSVPIQVQSKPVRKLIIKPDPDDLRETLADQINSEIKLPRRLPINPVKKEAIDEDVDLERETVIPEESVEKKPKKSKKKKSKKKKSKRGDSDSEAEKSGGSEKKKKRKKSDDALSSDDSNSGSDDKKQKRINGSESDEGSKARKERVTEPFGGGRSFDSFKRPPRDQSRDRKRFRRSRSRSAEGSNKRRSNRDSSPGYYNKRKGGW